MIQTSDLDSSEEREHDVHLSSMYLHHSFFPCDNAVTHGNRDVGRDREIGRYISMLAHHILC